MAFTLRAIAAAALAFATLASSHLIIQSPVPFGKSTLNNSPLVDADPWQSGSGSDYPCKQRPGVYDITTMNHIKVGEPNELSFIGSASHGGGTCQLAVTLDKEPDVNSVFKIFQVFEGGCPIDSDGNGMTHPFTWTLPKDFPNGVSTFAWFWYNRIGNRELYMNCAPISVTGGSDSHDYFNTLPNVYLINLPTSQCQSTYQDMSNAVTIPHPGQYILKETAGQDMHAATGSNCSAKAAAQIAGVSGYKDTPITNNGASYKWSGGSSGSSGAAGSGAAASSAAPMSSGAAPSSGAAASSGAAESSGAAPSAPAASAPASAPAASSAAASAPAASAPASSAAPSGSAFPQMSASGSAGIAGPSTAASAPASSGAASGPASSGVASAPAASASSSAGGSCSGASSSGGISCSSDGKQFGVCDNGQMVWRAVAPGTTCKDGGIVKRHVHEFRNPHVRRHARRAEMSVHGV